MVEQNKDSAKELPTKEEMASKETASFMRSLASLTAGVDTMFTARKPKPTIEAATPTPTPEQLERLAKQQESMDNQVNKPGSSNP
jgi:hypothetical protein